MRLLLHIYCLLMVVVAAPAFAQEAIEARPPGPGAEATASLPAKELPSVRVGRLSLVDGDADRRAVYGAGWVDAELNQPVFSGDALRTDPHARAEIRVGANTIDLANATEIEIDILNERYTQIALPRGRIGVRLRQMGDDETVEIDIPRGGLWLTGPGVYDIDAGSGEEPSRVAVFEGAARFVGPDSETRIEAGDAAVLTGSDPVTAAVEPATSGAFVEWCRGRDYDETRLAAPYYVSPYMTGFAELDAAGTWKINSEYGPVWVPTAPEAWAPYRFGHWSWIAPWGWTWIDDQPWGFAPSHYGRWAMLDEHWAWVPGSFIARPAYTPAVVAFLGTPGVGLSSAEGVAVGWFPLAPGEAHWPSYTRDLEYVRHLNLGNVADVDTIRLRNDGEPPREVFNRDFANPQFATVVPRAVFTNGRPVAPTLVSIPEQRLQNAPVLMGSPQIGPATRVARAPSSPATTPAVRVADRVSPRGGVKPLRHAAAEPRSRPQPVIIRGAHLHAPSYSGLSRARQAVVIRITHISRAPGGRGTRH